MLASLLALSRAPAELAEAEPAVGHQRTHTQLFGQRPGLAVTGFGGLDLRGFPMRGDLAEEAQRIEGRSRGWREANLGARLRQGIARGLTSEPASFLQADVAAVWSRDYFR